MLESKKQEEENSIVIALDGPSTPTEKAVSLEQPQTLPVAQESSGDGFFTWCYRKIEKIIEGSANIFFFVANPIDYSY